MREAEKTIRDIVERQKPFRDHVIKVKHNDGLYRHFLCTKPDSCNYHFNVILWPGWVAVTGDIGDLMVSRVPDMMTFIRGSIGSISYFAEKVPRSMPTKEYSPDRANQVIQEKIDEITEELDAKVKCDECDGGGKNTVEDNGETLLVDCDVCDGNGVVPDIADEDDRTYKEGKIEKLWNSSCIVSDRSI